MPLAVASSSPPELIAVVLEHLKLADAMQVVHSAMHEATGKPHPATFLSAAAKLQIAPEACLAFEDSPNGVKAAKAAGMKCIAVPEVWPPADPAFALADVVVNSLAKVDWPMMQSLWRSLSG